MVEMLQSIGQILACLAMLGTIVLLALMGAIGALAMNGTLWVVIAGLTLGYLTYCVRR
jgi:hypothetical protein